jgi:hypothetical protein
MSEQELLLICQEPKKGEILYWTSEVYGFGKWLRKFAFYPKSWPLNIYFSHGVTHHDSPALHEYENTARAILFFSPRLTAEYKNNSKKASFTILSPNVFYRKKFNIRKVKAARGTLAFPCHSTPGIDDLTDYREYCEKLKSLAEDFQPVSVCLHYHDINKGLYKVFMEHGFEVFTVGHPFHLDFIERFYEIITNFKYVTSNELGSYTYYAVEMDIPFLLYGNPVRFINKDDENIEKGNYDSFRRSKQMAKAMNILGNFTNEVTKEQKEFVEKELGVYDSISRFKACLVFYTAYFSYNMIKIKGRLKNTLKPYANSFKGV